MAKNPLWSDEYWLLLMQLYLNKPVGIKPLYSKGLVDISLELHIPPRYLHEQMTRLQLLETPRIKQLWETYGKNPRKLLHEVKLLKKMALKYAHHSRNFSNLLRKVQRSHLSN